MKTGQTPGIRRLTYMYCRQSLDKDGDALGVTRQSEDGRELAKRRGWTIDVELPPENDTSAKGTVKRPIFDQLIQAINTGTVGIVIAWNLDRLTRNRPDTVRLIEACQNNRVVIALVKGSDLDMSTSFGRMMADQLAGWARYEIEQKSERHQRANLQKAEAGKPHGCRRAFGFENDGLTLKPDEVEVLREMGRRVVAGHSFKEVCYWLNESGHKTAQGRPFYPITVQNTLKRWRYAGIREYKGNLYPAVWKPVFTRDEWDRLQLVIRMRHEKYADRPKARKYLGTGFFFCGKCGNPLNGETKRDHPSRPLRRTYNCRGEGNTSREGGCRGVTRNADALEEYLRQQIIARLDTDDMAALLAKLEADDTALHALIEERATKYAKLQSLEDDYGDGTLDKPTFTRLRGRVQTAIAAVEAKLDAIQHERLAIELEPGQTIAEAWAKNPNGWKRKLIARVIDRVDVHPGSTKPFFLLPDGSVARFDPSLIEIRWREINLYEVAAIINEGDGSRMSRCWRATTRSST